MYSGKKKCHTVKNTVICGLKKFIHFLGRTTQGNIHDLKLLEFDLPPFSEILSWCKVMADLGYLGIDKYYEIKELLMPHKKPRKSKQNPGPKLSDEQKSYNKQVSSIRIAVEHAIGGLKQFGILVQVFRNRLENFDDLVIEIAAGLWNLKLSN